MASPPDIPPVNQFDIAGPQRVAFHIVPAARVRRRGGRTRGAAAAGVERPGHGPNVFDDVEFGLDGAGKVPGRACLFRGDLAAGADGCGGAVDGFVILDPGFGFVAGGDVELRRIMY